MIFDYILIYYSIYSTQEVVTQQKVTFLYLMLNCLLNYYCYLVPNASITYSNIYIQIYYIPHTYIAYNEKGYLEFKYIGIPLLYTDFVYLHTLYNNPYNVIHGVSILISQSFMKLETPMYKSII